MKEVPRVVSVLVSETPPTRAVPPGVKPAPCCDCRRPVYLCASSRKLVAQGQARPSCQYCFARSLPGAGALVVLKTEEQARELEAMRRAAGRN